MDIVHELRTHGNMPAYAATAIGDKLKSGSILVDFDDSDGVIAPAVDVREQLVTLTIRDIDGPVKKSILLEIALMDDVITMDVCEGCHLSAADEGVAKGVIHQGQGTPVAVMTTDANGQLAFMVGSSGPRTAIVAAARHTFSPDLDTSEVLVITFS